MAGAGAGAKAEANVHAKAEASPKARARARAGAKTKAKWSAKAKGKAGQRRGAKVTQLQRPSQVRKGKCKGEGKGERWKGLLGYLGTARGGRRGVQLPFPVD